MKKLGIILVIFTVILTGAYIYIKGTPQYSLYQLRTAIEDHDPDKASLYLDIDSIVDNLMSDFINEQDKKRPENEWEAMGQNFAKGLMTMMLPTLKETMKGQFRTAITTPSDDKTAVKDIRKGKMSDFDIKVDGKMAIITKKDDKEMQFKMVKTTEGHWKIVQMILPNTVKAALAQ